MTFYSVEKFTKANEYILCQYLYRDKFDMPVYIRSTKLFCII